MNTNRRPLFVLLAALLVFAVAFGLRSFAADNLNIDYDEDDYLRAGQEFASLMRAGNWRGFMETNYRAEHPQMAKIMFGLSLLGVPEEPLIADVPITANPARTLPPAQLDAARTMSAVWGALTALLLALVNPLGGLILAVHSFTIKYTSQVMLDGFASLASASTALAYYLSKQKTGKIKTALLIASAVLLGLSASSKYLHSAVGFAILIDWFLTAWKEKTVWKFFRNAFLWGLLSLAAFFLFNPFYWPDPLERIRVTYEAVTITTTNSNVVNANDPTWQPLVYLSISVPRFWNREGFLFRADGIFFLLGIIGIAETWRKNRFIAIWLFVDIFILLIWKTKWAQYILVATVPLSFAAAEGIKLSAGKIAEWWRTKPGRRVDTAKPSRKETRRAIPWLVPGLIFFLILTIFPLVYQFAMSLTTLSGSSLRDGLQGGITREVLGGLTGQVASIVPDDSMDARTVHFVGLWNYPDAFGFLSGVGMTFFSYLWTISSVILQTALGVTAGLLLWNNTRRTRKFWQTIFILPWAIPEAVGALLWLNIFAPFNGWLALAVKKFGEGFPFANFMGWEMDSDMVFIVMLLSALWYGFPFIMLAVSAGLRMMPQEVFDAAAIDGASAWQTFRYITWPLLQPLVYPAMIVRAIFTFNQFYLFQMLIPYFQDVRMVTMSAMSYYVLYQGAEFSFSAAINIISMIMLTVFVILLNRWNRPSEEAVYA